MIKNSIACHVVNQTYPCPIKGRPINKIECREFCKYVFGAIACQAENCRCSWYIYRGIDVLHIEQEIFKGRKMDWTYIFVYSVPSPIRILKERGVLDMSKHHHCVYKGGVEGRRVCKDECYSFCGATLATLEKCLKEKCNPPWDLPCPICYLHFGEKALKIHGCMITLNGRCDGHQRNELDKRRVKGFAEDYGLDPLIEEDVDEQLRDNSMIDCVVFDEKITEDKCKDNRSICLGLGCNCERVNVLKTESSQETEALAKNETMTVERAMHTFEQSTTNCDRLSPAQGLDINDEDKLMALIAEMKSGQKQPIKVIKKMYGLCEYEIIDNDSFAIWLAARALQIKQVDISVMVEEQQNFPTEVISSQSEAAKIGELLSAAAKGLTSSAANNSRDNVLLVNDKVEEVASDTEMPGAERPSKILDGKVEADIVDEEYFTGMAKEVYERGNAFEIALTIELWQRKFKIHPMTIANYFSKSHSWPWQRTSILGLDSSILACYDPALPSKQYPAFFDLFNLSRVKSKTLQKELFAEMQNRKIKGSEILKWLKEIKAFDAPFDQKTKKESWIDMLSLGWFPVMAELAEVLGELITEPEVASREDAVRSLAAEVDDGFMPAEESVGTEETFVMPPVLTEPARIEHGLSSVYYEILIETLTMRLIESLGKFEQDDLLAILGSSIKREEALKTINCSIERLQSFSNKIRELDK